MPSPFKLVIPARRILSFVIPNCVERPVRNLLFVSSGNNALILK
jgi:hypothetical protein